MLASSREIVKVARAEVSEVVVIKNDIPEAIPIKTSNIRGIFRYQWQDKLNDVGNRLSFDGDCVYEPGWICFCFNV
jgi:hypothetical protein